MTCFYKKTFLKDLARVPSSYRIKIERLVFEDIPNQDSIFGTLDIKKMKGYRDYFRIRMGNYRIGCKIEKDKIIFYRVMSRDDIYRVFP